MFCWSQDQYQVHVGEYSGTAGDALADARGLDPSSPCRGGIKFSTYDHPNHQEADPAQRCVRYSKSGWWFCRWVRLARCRGFKPAPSCDVNVSSCQVWLR